MPQMQYASERFTVKAGKTVWINVDYSNPTAATLWKVESETVDTDDQATYDALWENPRFEYTDETPA